MRTIRAASPGPLTERAQIALQQAEGTALSTIVCEYLRREYERTPLDTVWIDIVTLEVDRPIPDPETGEIGERGMPQVKVHRRLNPAALAILDHATELGCQWALD